MAAEQRFRAMGSDAHLIVVDRPQDLTHDRPDDRRASALVERARHRIEGLERRWSRFLPESEISEINRRRGEDVVVSWETRRLVERGVEGWRLSGGRVDPTILDDLLRAGYDRSFEQLPAALDGTEVDVREAPGPCPLAVRARRSGCSAVRVGRATVRLPRDHGFDPGGLGKGLAADLVVEELRSLGAAGVCLNLGGDLRVSGAAPAGGTWTVAVERPTISPADRPPRPGGWGCGHVHHLPPALAPRRHVRPPPDRSGDRPAVRQRPRPGHGRGRGGVAGGGVGQGRAAAGGVGPLPGRGAGRRRGARRGPGRPGAGDDRPGRLPGRPVRP